MGDVEDVDVHEYFLSITATGQGLSVAGTRSQLLLPVNHVKDLSIDLIPAQLEKGNWSRIAFEISNEIRTGKSFTDLHDHSQRQLNVSAFTRHALVFPLLPSLALLT